jgi:hypothetical protein
MFEACRNRSTMSKGRVLLVDMEVIVRRDDGPAHDHSGRAGAANMRL